MEEVDEETKTCENCKREIPAANFTIHSVHCARNLRLCPVCKEPVPANQLNEHHDALHKPLPCKQCGESVCGTDLEDHIRDSCGHTHKSCRFCELELPRRDLPDHENYCGTRTEQCSDCEEWVMIKYRQLHLHSNHGFIRLDDDPILPQPRSVPPRAANTPNPSFRLTNVLTASGNQPANRGSPEPANKHVNPNSTSVNNEDQPTASCSRDSNPFNEVNNASSNTKIANKNQEQENATASKIPNKNQEQKNSTSSKTVNKNQEQKNAAASWSYLAASVPVASTSANVPKPVNSTNMPNSSANVPNSSENVRNSSTNVSNCASASDLNHNLYESEPGSSSKANIVPKSEQSRYSSSNMREVSKNEQSRPSSSNVREVIKNEQSRPSSSNVREVIKKEQSRPSSSNVREVIKNEQSRPSSSNVREFIKNEQSRPSSSNVREVSKNEQSRPSSSNAREVSNRPSSSNVREVSNRPSSSNVREVSNRPSSSNVREVSNRPSSSNVREVSNRPSSSNVREVSNRPSSSNVREVSNRPSSSNVREVSNRSSVNGVNIPRRTDHPQSSAANGSHVDMHPRGAVKKRQAPKPPREPQHRDLVREVALNSALNRYYDEQERRAQLNAYNAQHGLPPVLTPLEKLEKLRKMDMLHNREVQDDSWRDRLRRPLHVDTQPAGNMLGSNPGASQRANDLHAERRRRDMRPAANRNGASPTGDHRRNDLQDLQPMTVDEFTARYEQLRLNGGDDDEAEGAAAPMDVAEDAAPPSDDRFNEIKSSLHALRRGLYEATTQRALYNTALQAANAVTNQHYEMKYNNENRRSPSPHDDDDNDGYGDENMELPCEFCGVPVPACYLVQHQTGCRPDLTQLPRGVDRQRAHNDSSPLPHRHADPPGHRPPRVMDPSTPDDPVIPCEFCTKSLPVDRFLEHQERCLQRNREMFDDDSD